MTLSQVARAAGVSIAWVSLLERGQAQPSESVVVRVKEALGMVDELPYEPRRPAGHELVSRLGACLAVAGEAPIGRLAAHLGVSAGAVRRALRELEDGIAPYGLCVLDDGATASLAPAHELRAEAQQIVGTRPLRRLTTVQAEVLAIAIVNGAVTRRQVEAARGVDSAESLVLLTQRGYLQVESDGSAQGRPLVYRPTPMCLAVFGASTLEELRALLRPGIAEELSTSADAPEH